MILIKLKFIHDRHSFVFFLPFDDYDANMIDILMIEIFWIEFGGGAAAPVFVCVFVYVFCCLRFLMMMILIKNMFRKKKCLRIDFQ